MIRLTGTQRELMEILWENGSMTLHALTRAAIGNQVTPAKIESVRQVLLQMVTKKAVKEDNGVSPKLYSPLVGRDEVGFESGFLDAARSEGGAILNAFASGMGTIGIGSSDENEKDESKPHFRPTLTDEEHKEAIKEVMAQICRERDEYEAQKAAAKAAEENKED